MSSLKPCCFSLADEPEHADGCKGVPVSTRHEIGFKVHTARLFAEILINPQCSIMTSPLQIMDDILRQVAKRASELNDPELNGLMLRLTLYSIADPYSPDYDADAVAELLNEKGDNRTQGAR